MDHEPGTVNLQAERKGMDFPGYQLPEELQLLQRTVRRIIQEEIVPLEHSMDPEATELDDAHWQRLAAMNQNAGLWARVGGDGLDSAALLSGLTSDNPKKRQYRAGAPDNRSARTRHTPRRRQEATRRSSDRIERAIFAMVRSYSDDDLVAHLDGRELLRRLRF